MLVSPPFQDIQSTHDSFHANESTSSEPLPHSCSESFRNVCSRSESSETSSSPSSRTKSNSPKVKLHCGVDSNCDNEAAAISNGQHYTLESNFNAQETSLGQLSSINPNFSDGSLCADSSTDRKNSNESVATASSCETYFGYYDGIGCNSSQNGAYTPQHEFPYSNQSVLSPTDSQPSFSQATRSTSSKKFENITDKEMRKKLKNRESAQAARDRKKAKMLSLERQIKELLERNQCLEADNADLRARLRNIYSGQEVWRVDKPLHPANITTDSSIVNHYVFDPSAIGQQTSYPSNGEVFPYNRLSPCSNMRDYMGYSQQQQQVGISNAENSMSDNSNVSSAFNQLTIDPPSYNASPYPQSVWSGESVTEETNNGTFSSPGYVRDRAIL